jgi:hypothetical protein
MKPKLGRATLALALTYALVGGARRAAPTLSSRRASE